jgi:hypothetical protein
MQQTPENPVFCGIDDVRPKTSGWHWHYDMKGNQGWNVQKVLLQ